MRILFGPSHDVRHIDAKTPGAYEWWYFDALSSDGRYALVVIFFLGSPMTPYYKAVVEGKHPIPRDWCGIFISLHERNGKHWKERAYAYNLYKDGDFSDSEPAACIGDSRFSVRRSGDRWRWKLSVAEPGLWRGVTRAELAFTAFCAPFESPQVGEGHAKAAHTWVCIAPVCRVEGNFLLASGKNIAFSGEGYHDHNFGQLPYDDTEIWYWGRAHLSNHQSESCTAVFYETQIPDGGTQKDLFLFTDDGVLLANHSVHSTKSTEKEMRFPYGLRHQKEAVFHTPADLVVPLKGKSTLSSGPFYRRMIAPFALSYQEETFTGEGIAEVFRPMRLCGPLPRVRCGREFGGVIDMGKSETEPNPVSQIILTRTVQITFPSLAALAVLRSILPSERFTLLAPLWGIGASVGLSTYFAATFHARTPLLFPGGEPLLVRLPVIAQNKVALTFDDGPHPETTPQLLDILASEKVKATFFLVGERIAQFPKLARQIVEAGHTVGLHGVRHRTMVLQNARELAADLRKGQHILEEAIGQALTKKLLRPPYGFKTWTLAQVAAHEGWTVVSWSLDPRDYDPLTPEVLAERILRQIQAGDVILLHERPNVSTTAEALPEILRGLREKGFSCIGL